ncbi:MAG: SufS family cysteine desulfurase [Planctomycetaceae bacterium]
MSSTVATALFDVDALRADFPILGKPLPKGRSLVYLDSASSAQKPRVVIDKIREVYENYYANAYRGVYRFGARIDEELEDCREKIRGFIGAEDASEIVFTSGTTMSINLVAHAWGLKFLRAGDEILLNEMEHHANFVPWQRVAERTGATLRFIPLTADGRLDLDRLDDVLTDSTKLVAVTGMSNMLGTINPVEELAARAHERGAAIVVDGAQSVPHGPVDVRRSGIDFLAFSGHKLFGPSGVGVLYGKRDLLDAMDPFLTGGHMIAEVRREHSTWAAPPAKFEAGTLPIVPAIALGTAIDYVREIGFPSIQAHEHELLLAAHERLAEIPGMRIFGPAVEHKGSIVSFRVEGVAPEDLAQLLDHRGVFVRHGHHCTMPLHALLGVSATVRASFAFYNTLTDVDALADGIQAARARLRLA